VFISSVPAIYKYLNSKNIKLLSQAEWGKVFSFNINYLGVFLKTEISMEEKQGFIIK
jgi:hypothetical protein